VWRVRVTIAAIKNATMCSVCIVELQVTVKHTTMLSAAQKCLYGGFLSPEEQRTYGSLHAKRQDIFVPF
jgi:hypothetical protein